MITKPPIAFLAVAFVMASAGTAATAKDFRPQWIEAVNNLVKCNSYERGWITTTTGQCTGYKRPDTIAIGETFSANGKSRVIHVIEATQAEDDYQIDNFTIKKGTWYCVAGESDADFDTQGSGEHRIWLFIPQCIVVR